MISLVWGNLKKWHKLISRNRPTDLKNEQMITWAAGAAVRRVID